VHLIVGTGPRVVAQKLTSSGHLLEIHALAIRHVFLNQAARVGDLPLLVDVAILHGHPQSILVCLNQTTDIRDVEHIWVSSRSEVVWENCLLGCTL